jgi:Flp pilus assembly protein TadB
MAQTKRKRQTKHRGTQAGNVETKGRTSRPRSRAEAKQRAMKNRNSGKVERASRPPTWKSAGIRGVVAAGALLVFLIILNQPPAASVLVALIMVAVYVPMGFYTDKFLYERRLRKDAEAAERYAEEKHAEKLARQSKANKNGNGGSAKTAAPTTDDSAE